MRRLDAGSEGILAHGFARVRCPDCHHEYLLASRKRGRSTLMKLNTGRCILRILAPIRSLDVTHSFRFRVAAAGGRGPVAVAKGGRERQPAQGSFLTATEGRRRVLASGSGHPSIRPGRSPPTSAGHLTGQPARDRSLPRMNSRGGQHSWLSEIPSP